MMCFPVGENSAFWSLVNDNYFSAAWGKIIVARQTPSLKVAHPTWPGSRVLGPARRAWICYALPGPKGLNNLARGNAPGDRPRFGTSLKGLHKENIFVLAFLEFINPPWSKSSNQLLAARFAQGKSGHLISDLFFRLPF